MYIRECHTSAERRARWKQNNANIVRTILNENLGDSLSVKLLLHLTNDRITNRKHKIASTFKIGSILRLLKDEFDITNNKGYYTINKKMEMNI